MEKKDGRLRLNLALAACAVLTSMTALAQVPGRNRSVKTAILSPSRSPDSRGETVYEIRGRDEQDQPAIAGTFTSPTVLSQKRAFPDYPESMRRKKQNGAVEVEGVVAQDGRFIDLRVSSTSDPGFNENALKAAAKYEFQPATLDGKPVACLLRIEMTFNIR